MEQQTFPLGSDIKLKVTISNLGDGADLDTCSYELVFTSGGKSKTFTVPLGAGRYPVGIRRVDKDSVIVALPTTDLDRGDLYLKATVDVEDDDFEDGVRTEIKNIPCSITLE